MEEKEKKPLLIPENCPPVDYLIIGFTKMDAGMVALCGAVGAVLGIMIYAYNGNSIIAVAILFLFVMVAITVFRRNQYTENLFDKIRIIREYKKSQKIFEYEYVNIWEMERKKSDAADRIQSYR